jgi:hypothetical protein
MRGTNVEPSDVTSESVHYSADELHCGDHGARGRPETRSDREAGGSTKACLARHPRIEPINDLAVGSARVDTVTR